MATRCARRPSGTWEAARTRCSFARPRIRFRCQLPHTKECKRAQSIACAEDWRMLIPLSRLSALYHALRRSHQSFEHVHRHWRDRYSSSGTE